MDGDGDRPIPIRQLLVAPLQNVGEAAASQRARVRPSIPELADSSRVWAALPEVFEWGEEKAKGGEFRVCFPNIVMHARNSEGGVERFDYQRVENPSKVASLAEIVPKDRKKLPVRETVVCHLDK